MSEGRQRGRATRETNRVLDAWLRSRKGPAADAFALRAGERLHEARVYRGTIEGYRLEVLSKRAARGIELVATLRRPDATVSFQRGWDALDEPGYAAAVEEVEREVARLGLCDPERVQVFAPGGKRP
ncbi:hypothetical protein Gocc_0393 [Gaiella occulta]|uniref:Uncharacterized protein n=1 Tax=Gaiella occulta TaxID=1002870 RepID=A0A7M2Z277_9ACTN|nr:hypothetical protein [Gaiella occulta]RDI75974.1 hypothetical protein Gocc_0393 [Gaiella occulta]